MKSSSKPDLDFSTNKQALLEFLLEDEGDSAAALTIPRRRANGSARLSYAQERLWFIDQLIPGNPAYNVATGIKLFGEIDRAALERSFSDVVNRHEPLRTTFGNENGQPVQIINPAQPVKLDFIDLTDRPLDERHQAACRLSDEEVVRPFNLTSDPMLRVTLLKMAADEHLLLMTMHHIVTDGWSMDILIGELVAFYESNVSGHSPALAELPVQYADFAEWQRDWLQGEALESHLSFWRQELQGAPSSLDLPFDRPRPAAQTYEGLSLTSALPVTLSTAARLFAKRYDATLFFVLLAAFKSLIYRYTSQADLIIGTPVAARDYVELEGLIGFFVNTVVIRSSLARGPRFRELVEQVKQKTLSAFAYQDLPFERIVEELKPERDRSRPPIFQIVFGLHANRSAAGGPGAALTVQPFEVKNQTAKFDLTLSIIDGGDELVAIFEYNTDLFDLTTIERMRSHYQRLLDYAVTNPEQPVGELQLVGGEERAQILHEWNDTSVEYDREQTIAAEFKRQAQRQREKVAIICEDRAITYDELDRRSNQLGRYLRNRAVGPEVCVGICIERSIETVIGMLGILKAGGAYVPVDGKYPLDRKRLMMEEAGVLVMLTEQEQVDDELPVTAPEVIRIDADWTEIALESEDELEDRGNAQNLVYVMYTSGSTGRPKGVGVTNRGVVKLVKRGGYAELGENEVLSHMAPLGFDASTFEIWGSLLNGARLEIVKRGPAGIEEIIRSVRDGSVTTLWLTTALFEQVVKSGIEDAGALRQLVTGGEVVTLGAMELMRRKSPQVKLIHVYGPTETTTFASSFEVERVEDDWTTVPIGRPIENTSVYVLDDYMEAAAMRVRGEMYIGGDGLARCYVGRGDVTGERFLPNPYSTRGGERIYRTGDEVRYLTDGRIEFIGRKDHQVKIRGYRVEPGEIETVLKELTEIEEAAVVVRTPKEDDKRLVAYLVGRKGAELQWKSIRSRLKQRLPDYMIPGEMVELDELPKTSSGKTDRKLLAKRLYQGRKQKSQQEKDAARSPIEKELIKIWSEVLRVEEVGVNENFFELGGHSLLATRVITRVRETYGEEIPLRVMFEEGTVAALAASVVEALERLGGVEKALAMLAGRGEEASGRIERRAEGSRAPLSFAQERLWFLEQLTPGNALYNVPTVIEMKGEVDVEALTWCVGEIVRRHEVLRTRFEVDRGEPVQVVDDQLEISLPLIDLTAMEESKKEDEIERITDEEARRGFDLSNGPVIRTGLIKEEEDHWDLMVTIHHVASDAISMDIMVNEVREGYDARRSGRKAVYEELPIQYGDYAVWQRESLIGYRLEEQMKYWRERMDGRVELIELPMDRPRPAAPTYRGGARSREISVEIVDRLRRISREEGATMYMTLLAGYKALLHRYSGQENIIVGTPIAGRTRREVEGLIGFFVNMLVMNTDLGDNPGYREVVRRVREAAIGAYGHQEVPFEKIVEELEPERSLSHSPLFQVAFNYMTASKEELLLGGAEVSARVRESGTAKYDLTLGMGEAGGYISATLEYNKDLFDESTVDRMLEHLVNLLADAAGRPDEPTSGLQLMGEEEKQQILYLWNETQAEYRREETVAGEFVRQAKIHCEKEAAVYEGEGITYGELDRRSNQLGRYLRSIGVGPEVCVGICIERSLEMVIGLLGILKAGAAYVPLDHDYPLERLELMMAEAGVVVVLTEKRQADGLPVSTAQLVMIDDDWEEISGESNEPLESESSAYNLAYVMYTSGSTGRPKGVGITNRGIVKLVKGGGGYAEFVPEDVMLQMAPLGFDASTFEIWGALLNGGRLEMIKRGRLIIEEIVRSVEEKSVTTMWLTAALFDQVVKTGMEGLRGLKQLLAGGDVLGAGAVQRIRRELPSVKLVNGYGPTETTTFACCNQVQGIEEGRSIPIGLPIGNTKVYVLDEAMRPVPVGLKGELYIGGDGLARGYQSKGDLTAGRFVPSPYGDEGERLYKTGDEVKYLNDGRIEFIGRKDNQVKIRGYRVEPGEIEFLLKETVGVADAAVAVTEERIGDKRLVAYLVMESGRMLKQDEMRERLRSKLPDWMIPNEMIQLDELPMTGSGKIDRRGLIKERAEANRAQDSTVAKDKPRSAIEEKIAEIWREVLEVEEVGINDNFFEIGGHSLLAMLVIGRVREEYGEEIALAVMFEKGTIAGLAGVVLEAAERRGGIERVLSELGGKREATDGERIERRENRSRAPLSFAQARLWFLDQLMPWNPFYNVPAIVRMKGDIDVEGLIWSIREMVRRHEVLRTRIGEEGGEVVQIVEENWEIEAPVIDVSGIEGDEKREEEERRISEEEAREGFDLGNGPVIRARVVKEGEESWVLMVTMHHIVSDARSMEIMSKEISEGYEWRVKGKGERKEELEIQYGDYATWQRERLRGERLEEEMKYWREQLGEIKVMEMPTDRVRPAVQTYAGGGKSIELRGEMVEGLRMLSREEGVTMYMTMLAGFKVLLHRYSGEEEVVIGTPIAGRTRREVEGLIGFFVNMLVLKTGMEGEPSYREVMRRVKEVAVGGYEHQEVPFEKLVEEMEPERSLSHSPLFQVAFNYLRGGKEKVGIGEAEMSSGMVESGTAKYDLMLGVLEGEGEMVVMLEYNSDLYEEGTIERMLGHYEELLKGAIENGEQKVGQMRMLREEEREQLLREWNETGMEYEREKTVTELIEEQVERTPKAVALEYEGERMTYEELNWRSNRMGRYLMREGVGAETLVGLCIERGVEMVVAVLGIMKAGGAYVPLDPAYPVERLAYMAEDSGLRVLLTEEALVDSLPRGDFSIICVDRDWPEIALCDADNLNTELPGEQPAYVIYTSGSTGKPKGVQVPHNALTNFLFSMAEEPGLSNDDVLLSVTTLSFDIAGLELFLPLMLGARLDIVSRETAADGFQLARALDESGATIMQATPATWRLLFEAGWRGNPALKALCGGEALPSNLADQLRTCCRSLWNMYGPTETTIWSAIARLEQQEEIRIGHPIANTTIYVLDRRLELVPIGVAGELYIGGEGLACGYLDRPDVTAEKFVPCCFGEAGSRMYRTGDLARYRADGELEFVGRKDQQVKLRGHRIELGEIETALVRQEGVKEGVVVVREDREGEKQLVGYVVGEENVTLDGVELTGGLKKVLPNHMVPSVIVVMESLPQTANGKVDRKRLPGVGKERSSRGEYVGPRNDIEVVLVSLWQAVLGVDRIGIQDNFFEMGGHSLLATRLIARVRETFGVAFPLQRIFEAPTIAGMAMILEADPSRSEIGRRAAIWIKLSTLTDEEIQAMFDEKKQSDNTL